MSSGNLAKMEASIFGGLALTSGFSLASNLASFKHIYVTYDLSMSLYYILALDSAFAAIWSAIALANFVYLAISGKPDPLTCSLVVLSSPMISCIQPVLTFVISLIR